MKKGLLFLTALVLVCGATGFAASFQGLGDLPGGNNYSWAQAVSADGSTVVGRSFSETFPTPTNTSDPNSTQSNIP